MVIAMYAMPTFPCLHNDPMIQPKRARDTAVVANLISSLPLVCPMDKSIGQMNLAYLAKRH